jgi:Cdc6-like AAA superfamily ATPase
MSRPPPPHSEWEALSKDVQRACQWAAACEKTSVDVGTRALLIGILRHGRGRSPADDLLRHFGIPRAVLFEALRGGAFAIDPNVVDPILLTEMPRLSPNAQRCFLRAHELQSRTGRADLDIACLFGAILLSEGTARAGLNRVLGDVLIDELAAHYGSWLGSSKRIPYAHALAEAFPAQPRTGAGADDSASSAAEVSATEAEPDAAQPEVPQHGPDRQDPLAAAEMISIGNTSGAGNDVVAVTDQLGFDVYVSAFADLITSPHTKPPLTIGIFGSWGMGKSFLLEHIRRRIDQRQAMGICPGPRIHTVSFNAWEYSSTDAIWPALVRKIVKELDQLASWPRHKRVWTRVKWNLRRQWRSLWAKVAAGTLVATTGLAVGVGNSGVTAAVVATGTAFSIGGLIKAANDPVGRWVTALFADNDYGGQIQLMEDVKHDLDVLERRLHVTDHRGEDEVIGRILVVIDDLDRCEPAKAVEVLQAVNLLLNFSSFIVCLGIDARIVTAAVEKHYEGLLGTSGASGYEYLDKIVQIPFRIPEPNPREISQFIRSQLDVEKGVEPTAITSGPVGSYDAPASALLGETDEAAERSTSTTADPVGRHPAALPPTVPPPKVPFTLDEQEAFELFVEYLRPNPRHLKRLINVYRLVRSLGAAENERLMLDRPSAVLRWLIMWSQWPYTSMVMLRQLDHLGELPTGEAGRPEPDPILYLLNQVQGSIDDQARAEHDDDPQKLRGLLTIEGCGLSVEEIGRLRRYTVNFNPAVEGRRKSPGGTSPATAQHGGLPTDPVQPDHADELPSDPGMVLSGS